MVLGAVFLFECSVVSSRMAFVENVPTFIGCFPWKMPETIGTAESKMNWSGKYWLQCALRLQIVEVTTMASKKVPDKSNGELMFLSSTKISSSHQWCDPTLIYILSRDDTCWSHLFPQPAKITWEKHCFITSLGSNDWIRNVPIISVVVPLITNIIFIHSSYSLPRIDPVMLTCYYFRSGNQFQMCASSFFKISSQLSARRTTCPRKARLIFFFSRWTRQKHVLTCPAIDTRVGF